MEFTVIIHSAEEGGFWVEVPTLPGCFSQGETFEEAMENIREAIELHLEGLREDGSDLPGENDLIISRVRIGEVTG
ncbi:type II toxin-antitoxin system HicB family antitoxin [Methanocalculus taiwanensis]|uniref:Type II toxin-antitoxin system HicB family antitoxin n=1 Tax=Methanocalculus taiwanensis TaxID=106207 RepID=A0ABD4TH60_9EURY|nr:type II toxin-antitoxin system HicB family antitoxin [Methanocalculus taiwanensis]MCQ1538279.1 type II toxin-antitoxin system HicB family antitoxin [Methanocalculus taiwanensis]